MAVLNNLEPKAVFRFFEELSAVPRGTFHDEKISEYLVNWAKERNVEYRVDQLGNVIMKKPATAGFENSETVLIQGHMDMVCVKTSESNHDFLKDGLELVVDGNYVKAKDTSLGADNGIAVAMGLALIDSKDIPHPPLELLITVDEETGMGGATGVDLSDLKAKKYMNLDMELEGELTAGCAGGCVSKVTIPVSKQDMSADIISLRVWGLLGGHSGMMINAERGNGIKMMARLINKINKVADACLVSFDGGQFDNAINNDCSAVIAVKDAKKAAEAAEEMLQTWLDEFQGEEPGLKLDVKHVGQQMVSALTKESTERVLGYITAEPDGVFEYSRKLAGFVETSNNVGVVKTEENAVSFIGLIRSSVESRKWQVFEMQETCAKLAGGSIEIVSHYPGWAFNPDSALRKIMIDVYKNLYGVEPKVSTVHAGLECGILMSKKMDLDPVSFGPNLFDVHSVNEKLDIASTQRTWDYVKAILAACK